MSNKSFKSLAKEAIDYTEKGISLLVEVNVLQQALKNLPKSENNESLISEIIEKEKIAVNFIHQATIIERALMKKQHDLIEEMLSNLS